MKPIIVFFYIIIAAIILVQCTNQLPTPGTGPIETQPAAPSPTTAPVSQPTRTSLPATPVPQTLPPAIVNVKEWLANKLAIPVAQISVISYVAVDWPDSCMGINTPGVMCAMHVTPGYKVFLQYKGKVYELHSDKTGQEVLLAGDKLHSGNVALIAWQNAGQPCQQVTVSGGELIFGCYPGAKSMSLSAGRATDFRYFTQTYASFSTTTPAGQITFSGQGDTLANADQQRSLAEWARLVFHETQSGNPDPTWGLAMDYHRHGGIAGFADNVFVYSAGFATASTYNSDPPAFTKT